MGYFTSIPAHNAQSINVLALIYWLDEADSIKTFYDLLRFFP